MSKSLDFGDEGCRTYQRLESFLKRCLHGRGNEVRRAEPCIVVGRQFKQAFKFLVLTGSYVLVLENPPKYAKDIVLRVPLHTITTLEQIHDIPNFINGNFKGKAQHFLLGYKLVQDTRHASQGGDKQSRQTDNDSPQMGQWQNKHCDNDDIKRYDMMKQERLQKSQNSVTFRDYLLDLDKSFSRTMSDSRLPELSKRSTPQLNSGLSNSMGDDLSQISRRPLPKPPPGTESTIASSCLGRHKFSGRDRTRSSDHVAAVTSYSPKGDNSLEPLPTTQYTDNPILHSTDLKSSFYPPRIMVQSSKDHGEEALQKGDLQSSFSSAPKSLSSSVTDKLFKLLKGSKQDYSSMEDDLKNHGIDGLTSADSSAKEVTYGSRLANQEDILDIYILLEGSPFFQHIHSAWITSLMGSPFSLQPSGIHQAASEKHFDESRLRGLFNDLKHEILDCEDIATSFLLIQELSKSCETHFILKRLAWKAPELVHFLLNTLGRQMKLQPGISQRARADQIDYMIAVADVLAKMLQGTEHLRTRNKITHEKNGSFTKALSRVCVKSPEITSDPLLLTKNMSEGAALLLSQSCVMLRDMRQSDEIMSLLQDWIKSSTHLLFELFQATGQGVWCHHDGKLLTLTAIVRSLEQEQETISFLDALIKDILTSIYSKITPDDVSRLIGRLYRQYFVLKTLIQGSSLFLKHVHENYYEEIRYYVQSSLSPHFLVEGGLSSILAALMNEVNLQIMSGFLA